MAVLSAGCGGSHHNPGPTTASVTTTAPTAQLGAGSIGAEGVPLEPGPPLAPASSTQSGTPVDGIQCTATEQLTYHIHAHLQVYVDGQPRYLPGAIGMVNAIAQQTADGPFYDAQGCYYWLHVHAGDGVIHVESPTRTVYTLGEFFDEWRQPLSASRVASASGPVSAFVNGRPWKRSPRSIPLLPHAVIQLDIGSPVTPFKPMSWAGLNL
jgi:hypothetical protein